MISLAERYRHVRSRTEEICKPLLTEDYVIQSMPDVSPPKWHLGHTSWFFDTFLLKKQDPGSHVAEPIYDYVFNSYYVTVGARVARPDRGLLSRPSVAEVFSYRKNVDRAMTALFEANEDVLELIELGLQHEQQHQELLVTDIKHIFWINPIRPIYGTQERHFQDSGRHGWQKFDGGARSIGHSGRDFAFDNELPRHPVFVGPFEIASPLVTNGEFLEFMNSGGYETPELWLSDGWDHVARNNWKAPLYWERRDGQWSVFTLGGSVPIDENAFVAHVSYYEADAFARWLGKRLPTEAEWEVAAATSESSEPSSLWQWTSSSYGAYPGYRQKSGALGEYNGKFMSNRMVLRGGSWATPRSHFRPTYRNYFDPATRWQFTGIRLAA
jgi:ergothioneine biosynthesis protein EgtB